MADAPEIWQDYFEAARRKAEIASYHLDRLKQVTTPAQSPDTVPPIPVQAHFEGVVVSVMAAIDQVAQGVNSALGLNLSSGDLVSGAFDKIIRLLPPAQKWYAYPLGRDLRRLRTRMVHYYYAKSPAGLKWGVESADTNYDGSRELIAYSTAAVRYAEELGSLLPGLEVKLRAAARSGRGRERKG
jgi:hypothetical protein